MGVVHEWELVRHAPHPALRGAVTEYLGYRERIDGTLRRRELPAPRVTVILNLGAPLRIGGASTADALTTQAESFIAGLHTSYSLVETVGEGAGIEISLTPLAARRFLGAPLSAVADRVVSLDDILGPRGRAALERIREAPTWDARFALLDLALRARLDRAPATPTGVAHAWHRLTASDARPSVRAVATELGWSEKRLVGAFRDQIGLAPKQVSRLVRFQHAVTAFTRPGARLTAVAHGVGYYDQAHLIRDVRAFAGVAPTELLREKHPEGMGFIDD